MALDPRFSKALEKMADRVGLDELRRRVDKGEFGDDPARKRELRAWISARKAWPLLLAGWKLLLGIAAIVGAAAALIAALK